MNLKKQAALQAVKYVHSGQRIGLGSGSTVSYFIKALGDLVKSGDLVDIQAVSTSDETSIQAQDSGIPFVDLDHSGNLDITVDGADEIDHNLNLVKGLGKALLREKIVAAHSNEFVIIADESKLVSQLGDSVPLPIEVVKFGIDAQEKWLQNLGCVAEIWRSEDGSMLLSDNGNPFIRCWFKDGIKDPSTLDKIIKSRVGIIEHGLFLGMATRVIVANMTEVVELTI